MCKKCDFRVTIRHFSNVCIFYQIISEYLERDPQRSAGLVSLVALISRDKNSRQVCHTGRTMSPCPSLAQAGILLPITRLRRSRRPTTPPILLVTNCRDIKGSGSPRLRANRRFGAHSGRGRSGADARESRQKKKRNETGDLTGIEPSK